MFVVLIINSVVIIGGLIVTDEEKLALYDKIDGIVLYFYIGECVIKIIGFGVQKYWDDDWNKFDFIMVLISVFASLLYEVITVLS
jgi:voltage-gated sodium channel